MFTSARIVLLRVRYNRIYNIYVLFILKLSHGNHKLENREHYNYYYAMSLWKTQILRKETLLRQIG